MELNRGRQLAGNVNLLVLFLGKFGDTIRYIQETRAVVVAVATDITHGSRLAAFDLVKRGADSDS